MNLASGSYSYSPKRLRRLAVAAAAIPIALLACTTDEPPRFNAIADLIVLLGESMAVPFTVTDENLGALVVAANSSDQAVLADSDLVLEGTGGNRTLMATPSALGTAVVTITATDAGGQHATAAFSVTVEQPYAAQSRLLANAATGGDSFGYAVALEGGRAVIGAPINDDGAGPPGAVYVFELSGTSWRQVVELTGKDTLGGDMFGAAVALSGDRLLVGAPFDDHPGLNDAGSVYVFEFDGAAWVETVKLVAGDAAAGAWFGQSVALSGDRLLVGASGDAHAGERSGAAYVFELGSPSRAHTAKLVTSDAAASDEFGWSVALDGDRAVVTALRGGSEGDGGGSAHVFEHVGSGWVHTSELKADPDGPNEDFGVDVALDSSTIVVGATANQFTGSPTDGSATVFELSGPDWLRVERLTPHHIGPGARFGSSVAVGGGRVLVGATFDTDEAGFRSGSAFVFERIDSTYRQIARLAATDAAGGDRFGTSVAIDGEWILVGADLADNDGGVDAGSVYVFQR